MLQGVNRRPRVKEAMRTCFKKERQCSTGDTKARRLTLIVSQHGYKANSFLIKPIKLKIYKGEAGKASLPSDAGRENMERMTEGPGADRPGAPVYDPNI